MIIVNGQQQTNIPVADRGLQYGDGCFTTIAYRQGMLELFELHVQRLKDACERLFIPFDRWPELTQQVCFSLAEANKPCVVKILITRGQGGRGYSPQGCENPSYVISLHPIPVHYLQWQQQGIALTVSPIKLAKQPLLAGLKHNNRLEQVLMKQALVHSDYHDALVCDADDHVIETSMANVFWHLDNIWYTPELEQCGVEGVAKKALVSIMQEQGIMLREVKIPLAELTHLDEMFVCNSLQKIIPVTHVVGAQGQTRIKVSTNKRTFELQEWFNQYLANHSYTLGC